MLSIAMFLSFAIMLLIATNANAEDGSIEIGETKTVTVTGANFQDSFSFKTADDSRLYKITITNSTVDAWMCFSVYSESNYISYYDEDYTDHFEYCSETSGEVGRNSKDSYIVSLNKNKTYYLCLANSGERDETLGTYKILVEKLSDPEPDTSSTAMIVNLGKMISGSIVDYEDEDWFKFTAPSDGYYRIKEDRKVGGDYFALYDDEAIEIYNYKIDKKKNYCVTTIKLKKNESLYLQYSGGTDQQFKYKFVIRPGKNPTPPKAVIKSVKPGKRTLIVNFKKAKNANQYQIALKKKGAKKWKFCKVTGLSKKYKKLARKKKYQVKVRAINKEDKDVFYGKWSKVRTVKVK